MTEDLSRLIDKLPAGAVVTDPHVTEGYRRDRADLVASGAPLAVVRATCVAGVSTTLAWASERGVPVVPCGAGNGLSGVSNVIDGCVTLSLERMTAIREINTRGQYAIVEAGVINAELGRARRPPACSTRRIPAVSRSARSAAISRPTPGECTA
jgi:glycolate oxidase